MKGNYNIDLMLSLGIFFAGVFLFYTMFPNVQSTDYFPDEKKVIAHFIADNLVSSPGYPKDWKDINDVQKLGLAYFDGVNTYPNIIDETKADELNGYNCSELKDKLGINVNFSIEIAGQDFRRICVNNAVSGNRYVERSIYITPNGIAYIPGVLRVYV